MDKEVLFFNYPLQFKSRESEYLRIIQEVLSRGAYILGRDVEQFEHSLAQFLGVKYTIGVDNCTDALLVSLYAAGIKPGDEIITASHAFVATAEVIRLLGARPIFVDIADDHGMNVDLIERAITSSTKAILPVHLNGRICNKMDELVNIAEKHRLLMIEDAAQALGASYKGIRAGTFGIMGCFSFYPAKLLGAFGDAGAIVTNDNEVAKKLMFMRNHGRDNVTEVRFWGINSRLDNLQAALLNYKLKLVPTWIKRRRDIAHKYHEGLKALATLRLPPPPVENGDHYDVFQNYELEAERRGELTDYLKRHHIHTSLPWGGKAIHQFNALGLHTTSLPHTDEVLANAVMLPMYPELTNEEIDYVVETIQTFYLKG